MSVKRWIIGVSSLLTGLLLAVFAGTPAHATTVVDRTTSNRVLILPDGSMGTQQFVVHSDAVAQPNGCQGASATLTLETTARGYTYDCSGTYTNAAGTTAYYLFPGGWSGVLYTYTGSTEYDYLFCDFHNFSIANHTVIKIYLSPTKEPWC